MTLIPEKRLDKNGVLTTKHVRATPAASSAKALPSPKLAPAAKKPVLKLTPTQKKQKDMSVKFNYDDIDAELTDRISGSTYGATLSSTYSFTASEAEFYDVHSIASYPNASLLLKHGVRSKEDALALLSDLHLGRLVEDHSVLAEDCLKRRISFETYKEFNQFYPDSRKVDQQLRVDAAELFSIKAFQKANKGLVDDLFKDVLSGKIAAEDMKVFGAAKFTSSMAPRFIVDALAKIKDGSADYDAVQVRDYLERVNKEASFATGLAMINSYGFKFMEEMTSIWKTHRVSELVDNLPMDDQREILHYNNEIDKLHDWSDHLLTPREVIELFEAGISPETVVRKRVAGMSVYQVIATEGEDVHAAVGKGWL